MKAFLIILLFSSIAIAEGVPGPAKYYVDSDGRYLGIFKDSVHPDSGAVLHSVAVPQGSTLVTSTPPSQCMKWENMAWVADTDCTPPVADPLEGVTARQLLDLLIANGAITQDDLDNLAP